MIELLYHQASRYQKVCKFKSIKSPAPASLQGGAILLLDADSDLGIADSGLSAVVVTKPSEMLSQLFELVLLAAVGIGVVFAIVGVAADLAMFFGVFGPRHDSTSLARDALYVLFMLILLLYEE